MRIKMKTREGMWLNVDIYTTQMDPYLTPEKRSEKDLTVRVYINGQYAGVANNTSPIELQHFE